MERLKRIRKLLDQLNSIPDEELSVFERKLKAKTKTCLREMEWYWIPFPVMSISGIPITDNETIDIPMLKGAGYDQTIDGVEELFRQFRNGDDSAIWRLFRLYPDAYDDPAVKEAIKERANKDDLSNLPRTRAKGRGRPFNAILKGSIVLPVNTLSRNRKTSKHKAFELLDQKLGLSFERIRNAYYEGKDDRSIYTEK